jgi:hypothetical protein
VFKFNLIFQRNAGAASFGLFCPDSYRGSDY